MSDDLYDGPCEAGCISFHGGERKHHKDCGHYPHSLTKVNADRIEERDDIIRHDRERIEELVSMVNSKADRIEELEAKLAKAVGAMEKSEIMCRLRGHDEMADEICTTLAELKGEDRG